jgi:hypothetical protein
MTIRQSGSSVAVRDMITSSGVGGPTALRIMLGGQLGRLREAKRITLEDAWPCWSACASKPCRHRAA